MSPLVSWASYTVRYVWHILTRYAHIKTHTIKICICTCMIFGYNCTGLETISKFSWEVKEKARQRKRLWKQDQEEESETLRKREKYRYGYTFIILCFLFWLFFKGWFEMGTLLQWHISFGLFKSWHAEKKKITDTAWAVADLSRVKL